MKVNELQYSITLNEEEIRSTVKALHEFYMQYRDYEGDVTKAHAERCRELRNTLGRLINTFFCGDEQ